MSILRYRNECTLICVKLITENLKEIPENDPHSLTLPVDPLDVLPEKLKLKEIPPYDVRWSVERNVLDYIKSCAASSAVKSRLKSSRIWDEEEMRSESSE